MAKSVLIIGGGIIGLCSAFNAARKGHTVTVLERGGPAHDSCVLGSAGMVVPSHFIPLAAPGMVATGLRMMLNPESPFYIRPRADRDLIRWGLGFWRAANRQRVEQAAPLLRDLNLASRQCFTEFANLTHNDFGLERKGLLMLCRTAHGLGEETRTAEQARRLDVPAEVLTAEATAKLEPALKMDIAGAVYYPMDCHLTPHKFMTGLERWLAGHQVSLVFNAAVTGWRMESGRIAGAIAGDRVFEADEYVLAGGAWSMALAAKAGVRLPMQAGKGYSLTLPVRDKMPAICSILTEGRATCTPLLDGLRFAGTMEIVGLDESINVRRVNGLIKSICRFFPEFAPADFAGVPVWRGLRPCTPDGLPCLGRSRQHSNLLIATGHGMMGLSLGPITGKIVGELLSGERPSLNIDLLSPQRFS